MCPAMTTSDLNKYQKFKVGQSEAIICFTKCPFYKDIHGRLLLNFDLSLSNK